MFSWRCFEKETSHTARTEALTDTCAPERKRSSQLDSVEVCQGNWEKFSLWGQEAPLFRYAQIVLPVRGPLGDYYFCIYLFYHVFVLSFQLIVFFKFLILSPQIFLSYAIEKKFAGRVFETLAVNPDFSYPTRPKSHKVDTKTYSHKTLKFQY